MKLQDRIAVVTGAASGIGRALAVRFHQEGAKLVVCADINTEGVAAVARQVQGVPFTFDARDEKSITNLIERVEKDHGPIDLFFSNAGIAISGGAEVSDADWQCIWEINLMAHVWAARHLVPKMLDRGGGYLLSTASAAGLLSQVNSAPYAVTKHAAVAFAEWLAISHGEQGLKVSVLCPQGVRTAMTAGNEEGIASINGMLEPEAVAEVCVQAIAAEHFLILPHQAVAKYMQNKTKNYDKWIKGMQRLNRQYKA